MTRFILALLVPVLAFSAGWIGARAEWGTAPTSQELGCLMFALCAIIAALVVGAE